MYISLLNRIWQNSFFCLQAQLVVLASQISWSESVDGALQTISTKDPNDLGPLSAVLESVESTLNILADSVLYEQPPVRRRKLEHLVSALTLILLNLDMPSLCKQCRSRSAGFFRSQLIWIYTVCH